MRGTKPIRLAYLALIYFSPIILSAQYTFTGVFHSGSNVPELLKADSWEEFKVQEKSFQTKGYVLNDLEVAGTSQQKAYWATFKKSDLTRMIQRVSNWSDLQEKNKQLTSDGWLLVDVEASPFGRNEMEFLGVWEKKKDPTTSIDQQLWKLTSLRSVLALSKQLDEKRYYAQDIEHVLDNEGNDQYIISFEKGFVDERTHVVVHVNPGSFLKDRLERFKSGYRLIDMESFDAEGKSFYVGVFKKLEGAETLKGNLNLESLNQMALTLQDDGLVMTDFEVFEAPVTSTPPETDKVQTASAVKATKQ